MFRKRNKEPILVATTCAQLEELRAVVEVIFGLRITIVCYDFNTRTGSIKAHGVSETIPVERQSRSRGNEIVKIGQRWFSFHTESTGKIVVAERYGEEDVPNFLGRQWSGTSMLDRKETKTPAQCIFGRPAA